MMAMPHIGSSESSVTAVPCSWVAERPVFCSCEFEEIDGAIRYRIVSSRASKAPSSAPTRYEARTATKPPMKKTNRAVGGNVRLTYSPAMSLTAPAGRASSTMRSTSTKARTSIPKGSQTSGLRKTWGSARMSAITSGMANADRVCGAAAVSAAPAAVATASSESVPAARCSSR